MAMGVVDALEMVDVEHQQQCGLPGTGHAINLAFQHGAKVAPIGQACERVLQGQLAQAVDDTLHVCSW